MIGIVLAVLAISLLVALFVVTWLALRKFMGEARRSSRYKLTTLFREEDMLRHDVIAHCYGFESGNGDQWRGNGALVLTAEKLWYSKMGSAETLEIPMSSIRDAEVALDFHGELGEGRLLIVTFERNGWNDRIGFFVAQPHEWRIAMLNLSQHPGT